VTLSNARTGSLNARKDNYPISRVQVLNRDASFWLTVSNLLLIDRKVQRNYQQNEYSE
jgi:hypothetical protein